MGIPSVLKKTASHVKVYTVNKEPEWGGMEEFFVHPKDGPGYRKNHLFLAVELLQQQSGSAQSGQGCTLAG